MTRTALLSQAWRHPLARQLRLALAALLLCVVALQAVWGVRVLAMRWVDPQSTAFQRSDIWRTVQQPGTMRWRHEWVPLAAISVHLQRAVIASEDSGFAEHGGIEWEAVQHAMQRNAQASGRVSQRRRPGAAPPVPKLVGGSTITQQLAKNLFLSGERTWLRKVQEAGVALALEAMLPKARILEIYLNNVEWGEGVFGAQAAALHHFGVPAQALTPPQAARLAVMLPAPKRFERLRESAYLRTRSHAIAARMGEVDWPPTQ